MSSDGRASVVLGVGIDVTSVTEVRHSIDTFGDAYLSRLFTSRELSDCGSSPERLGARFAAKEAAFKALRLDDRQPPWTSVEVRRRDEGWCELGVSGTARAMSESRGVTDLLVCLTHDADVAAAVVVALGTRPPRSSVSPTSDRSPSR